MRAYDMTVGHPLKLLVSFALPGFVTARTPSTSAGNGFFILYGSIVLMS